MGLKNTEKKTTVNNEQGNGNESKLLSVNFCV